MAVVEKTPGAEPSSEGSEESGKWIYVVEHCNGIDEHDDVLYDRADKVEQMFSKPLPDELVKEVDAYIGDRLGRHEDNPELAEETSFDRSIAGVAKEVVPGREKDSQYVQVINSLRSKEERQGQSLDEIFAETKALSSASEKAERLRALRALGTALNDMQPPHANGQEWSEMTEEQKRMTRVAELMKLRVDVMASDAVYKSKGLDSEQKQNFAREVEEVFEDYARGDDIPSQDRANLRLKAAQAKNFLKLEQGGEEDGGRHKLSSLQQEQGVDNKVRPPEAAKAEAEAEAGAGKIENQYVGAKIFGREAIKRSDTKAVEEELRELSEKEDAKSVFAAARQLAHLKRAGVGMSDKGREYFSEKLNAGSEAMREHGVRAVVQYHAYLKYLGVEDSLAEEDAKMIRLGILDRTSNKKTEDLSALAVNAKYLGVLEDSSTVQERLQEDIKRQLNKSHNEDKVALEMARRKYLGLPHGLPKDELHASGRIDSKVESYRDEKEWANYARLKSLVVYARGGGRVDQKEQEAVIEHIDAVRELAKDKKEWSGYASYVADAVALSRQCARGGQETQGRQIDETTSFLVNSEADETILSSREHLRGMEKLGGDGKERAKRVETSDTDRTARPEESKVEPDRPDKPDKRGVESTEEAKDITDILKAGDEQLLLRERYLLEKRKALQDSNNNSERAAAEKIERLKKGADFNEVLDEERFMAMLRDKKVSGAEREDRRRRYLGILRNELGHGQDLEEGGLLNRATSNWTEKVYARVRVAKGLGKLRALWPGRKSRLESGGEVIKARQDTVVTMRKAARGGSMDGESKQLLSQLADEYELLNVREAADWKREKERLAVKTEAAKKESADKKEEPKEELGGELKRGKTEEELRGEIAKKLKKKYKKKYREKGVKINIEAGKRKKRRKAA